MTSDFASRVAERASQIRFAQVLLTILASPFWLIGAVAGLVWVCVTWCAAAVVIGFSDAHERKVDRGAE